MSRAARPPGARSLKIGENAREIRESKSLTRGDIADRMGTTHDVVANLELGRSLMSAEQLIDLAAALKVPIGRLLRDLPAA